MINSIYEIPLYLQLEKIGEFNKSDKVIFSVLNKETRRKQRFFLTFGGNYDSKPKRIAKPVDKPQNVTAFRRIFPNDITSIRKQVDCLIIYPEEFSSQAAELAEIHQRNFGITDLVIDQQDIFNQFSGGTPDKFAIQNYIEDVFNNFDEPHLRYVVLLGSGTKDWDSSTEKNKIITWGNGVDGNFVIFSYRKTGIF